MNNCVIDSKEEGGDAPFVLYESQKRFLREVFDGLSNDIHTFVVLKARQLGLSTVTRALVVFWAFMHPGLKVALVYDTELNKEAARNEVKRFLEALPSSHRVTEDSHNRYQTVLSNGSTITYFVAGIKKTKSSGGLGRSHGINCCGCTEISSWDDVEGLRAFERSLAQKFPDRLYIWESTPRGYNIFYDVWREAKADDLTKRAIFIGWWANENYTISRDDPRFERYGINPPTEEEQTKIDIVADRYGHNVSMEQLAWFRHEYDPSKEEDGEEHVGQEIIQQELPWMEEEAFLMSGTQFFPSDKLSQAMSAARKVKPQGWNYSMTSDFLDTVPYQERIIRRAQLKIWDEPEENARYVIGADPAYGSSDDSYNHCAQVLRCYADGVDQVAEFCDSTMDTSQFAWVLLHLAGAYKHATFLMELNGPGHAVWAEIRSMKNLIQQGYLREIAMETGLDKVFRHVRDYVWAKEDSITRSPSAFHWETNTKRKITVMDRLKGLFNTGAIKIKSQECLVEMQRMVRDGDTIKGEGTAKYDRVMALSLAVRCWEDSERRTLVAQQRTREYESNNRQITVNDLQKMFSEGIVGDFFTRYRRDRLFQERMARRGRRWAW